jgi:hypothetical protein
MAELSARGLDQMRGTMPQVYESLKDIVNAVNQLSQTAGIAPKGATATPQNLSALNVTAADGIFDAQINDPSPARGENYFLEWDENQSFSNAKTIPLNVGRSWRGQLGARTLYFRTYKQLPGSNVSPHVYNSGGVNGAQSNNGLGPAPQKTTGSGTSMIPGHGIGPIGPIQPVAANV